MDFMEPDTRQIGTVAMELMEEIAETYPGASVRTVALVVELDSADGTRSIIEAKSTERRVWVTEALLRRASSMFNGK